MDGFLFLDKPVGPTSHDVVAQVRRFFPRDTKVGHAGTLDPLASGLLILGVGRATKMLGKLVGLDKMYEFAVTLGATSITDDAEGPIIINPNASAKGGSASGGKIPTTENIEEVLKKFLGDQEQAPPIFSAKKVGGERLYKKARRGDHVEIKPYHIIIKELKLLSYHYPDLQLRVHCSSGTYVRALARDIGQKLGIGGYVSELCRTAIGPFTIETAIPFDQAHDDQFIIQSLLHSTELLRQLEN